MQFLMEKLPKVIELANNGASPRLFASVARWCRSFDASFVFCFSSLMAILWCLQVVGIWRQHYVSCCCWCVWRIGHHQVRETNYFPCPFHVIVMYLFCLFYFCLFFWGSNRFWLPIVYTIANCFFFTASTLSASTIRLVVHTESTKLHVVFVVTFCCVRVCLRRLS